MSILAIIMAVQDAVLTVPGIHNAPDYPPDSLNGGWPFVITYIDTGKITRAMGKKTTTANIVVELHVGSGTDLSRACKNAMTYAESVPDAIINALKNTYAMDECELEFGPLGWDKTKTIGFRWKFPFREMGV